MELHLPPKEVAIQKNWNYQVSWEDEKKPCWIRLEEKESAERWADDLRAEGFDPVIVTNLLN